MDTLIWDPYRLIPDFFGQDWLTLGGQMSPTAWHEFERAEIDQDTFLRRFFKDERDYDHDGLLDVVLSNYRWLPGVEQILIDLKACDVEMHALSNYPSWWTEIERQFELSRYLDWSFVSCLTGVRKPDPEAFLGPPKTLNRPVSELVFIDDRKNNVEAASDAGLTGLLFKDAKTLRAELADLGVLPTPNSQLPTPNPGGAGGF